MNSHLSEIRQIGFTSCRTARLHGKWRQDKMREAWEEVMLSFQSDYAAVN